MYLLPAMIVVTIFLGCDKFGVRDTSDTNHAQQDFQQTSRVNPKAVPTEPDVVRDPPPPPPPNLIAELGEPFSSAFAPIPVFGISHGGGAPGKSKRGRCPNLCEGFVFNIDFCEDTCEGFVESAE